MSKDDVDVIKADDEHDPGNNLAEERIENSGEISSEQVLTLAIHEKPSIESASAHIEGIPGGDQLIEQGHKVDHDELLIEGRLGSPKSKKKDAVTGKVEGKGTSVLKMNSLFTFGSRSQDENRQKVRLFTGIVCLPGCFIIWSLSAELVGFLSKSSFLYGVSMV